ncbi:DNA damage-regulated autophagy modulator protein 2-like [Lycorma delicatula]|uniref:DNA damage-regulated autophagy modulator protein 2-like n=1 Tax=Lycorma delicatula TaxID=130591 RepID=UPI003F5171A8
MMRYCAKHVHMLPVLVCMLFPLTFIITFLIAVALNDVFPGFPYISDTGTLPPESCIFSLLLNICSILLGGCIYIRHLQIVEFARKIPESGLIYRDILTASIFGGLSCTGLNIVANFQVSNVQQVHYFGAVSCLWGGSIYFIYQTMFSFKMGQGIKMICIFYTRYMLCVLSVIFNISFIVSGMVAYSYYTGNNPRKWKPTEAGWFYHVVSSSSEWMLALTHSVLVCTFLPEFKKVHVELPVLCWHQEFLNSLQQTAKASQKHDSNSNGDIICMDGRF